MSFYFLFVLLLHFYPKKALLKRLFTIFQKNGYIFSPQFSGRVALKNIINFFSSDMPSTKSIYIPDYICNVVFKAVQENNYSPVIYPTDERGEPHLAFLKKAIRQKKIGVIILANVFGSSALLKLLNRPQIIEFIEKENIKVILDLCQDITLLKQIPFSKNIGTIISFNNKSFPGVMGGGILYHAPLKTKEVTLSVSKKVFLYYDFLRKIKSFVWPSLQTYVEKKYDYSECISFPYTFENYNLTKLQCILALAGLKRLPFFLNRKRKFACAHSHKFLLTYYYKTSPYLILRDPSLINQFNRSYKMSYAKPEDRSDSYKKIAIINNKGF